MQALCNYQDHIFCCIAWPAEKVTEKREIRLNLHLNYILEWYSSTAQGAYIYRASISKNPFHLVYLEIQDNLQEQLFLCLLKLKAQDKDISIWPH